MKRKYLDLIYDDLKKFYEGYEIFSISTRRLAAILRGIEYNTFDILLVAFFENIKIEELCNICDSLLRIIVNKEIEKCNNIEICFEVLKKIDPL